MIEYVLIAAGGYLLGRLFDGDGGEGVDENRRLVKNEKRLGNLERDANLTTQILENQHTRLVSVEDATEILTKKIGAIVDGSSCPECGRQMVLRQNRRQDSPSFGKFFFGCSGFPAQCKKTLNMPADFVSRIAIRNHRPAIP
jgi:hypothetical protein